MRSHWEQGYNALYVGGSTFYVCAGCGCLVHDRATHDQWHRPVYIATHGGTLPPGAADESEPT